ncbi:MAG: DegT/DnrJ/EryC1/StrS family aminotransferase [Treponema sp.]|jgi:dTDP-4-amino-4,6-dideoxygalactose transaminase|nr:DegT/DnrJ/EryC1/StrS family aminotransferase [Treponema sp.]
MKIEVYSPTIRRKEMDAVLTAMVEEKIGPGDRNRLLIQTAKEQMRFDYALALRSPAVALHLSLKALDVKTGQGVLVSALSPQYYLQVIKDLQLTPVFCDVTYDFPCINRETIEKAMAKKPDGLEIGAVVLHHTLGFVPDALSILELGIPVIEDISHSYGSWLKPKEESTEKDSSPSQTSAFPVIHGVFCILGLEEKDMLTSGGGALLFAMNRRDGSVLRNYSGIADEYCLPDINAALAIIQFKEAQRNIERRNEIANFYVKASLQTRHKRFISRSEDENNKYSFSLVLETGLKDVIAYAKKKEILLDNAFEKTIAASLVCENCPVSSSLVLRTVLFPMYPRLRSQEVERVSRLIMTLP